MAPFVEPAPDILQSLKELTIQEEDHLGNSSQDDTEKDLQVRQPRPYHPRRTTDPSHEAFLQPYLPPRPRNRSPYSKSHLRSHSNSSPLSAPPMARAHSSPTFNHSSFLSASSTRSPSPLHSPARVHSPSKHYMEDTTPLPTPSPFEIESISEDSELDLTPRAGPDRGTQSSPLPAITHGHTFPRRRAPVSPLHQVSNNVQFGAANAAAGAGGSSTPTSSHTSSPLLLATKFNESFPSDYNASTRSFSSTTTSSSVPSTPTSARSRSPSISSLETIPDSPDAEMAALEEDNIARLKAAADAADGVVGGDAQQRRSSLEIPGARPVGFGFGRGDKRKRWSVCGGERRGDLDLETIWED